MLNLKFKDERNIERRESVIKCNAGDGKSFSVIRSAIYFANLGEGKGSIQGSIRPVIICSNYKCNENSPVVTVIPLTSQLHKRPLPTHVSISKECGLEYDSTALVEQIMPLNKTDLISYIGRCTEEEMVNIEKAIQIQNGIKVSDNYSNKTNYYSTSSKFETEVFDIYKAKKLSRNIIELEKFINKYDNPEVNPVKESLKTLIDELSMYCKKFGKNISLFYRPMIKNCETKNYKGAVAIG